MIACAKPVVTARLSDLVTVRGLTNRCPVSTQCTVTQQTYGQATSENYYLFLVNNRPKQCVPGHGHAMSMYETKKRTRTLDIGNIHYRNYMAGVELRPRLGLPSQFVIVLILHVVGLGPRILLALESDW